jgi:hypothetical protein
MSALCPVISRSPTGDEAQPTVETGHEETHAPQPIKWPKTERPPRGGLSKILSGV